MSKIILVIPCYNEARRLESAKLSALLEGNTLSLLFVDDGSTDSTRTVLSRFCAENQGRSELLIRAQNGGKAAAVQEGLRRATLDGATIVGYGDADLSTPPEELIRLARILNEAPEDIKAVLGSRIQYLGAHIQRSSLRHYCGRIFATLASLTLKLAVYDTQCGAKYFRVDAVLRRALGKPFQTHWIFDVELLGRLWRGYCGVKDAGTSPFIEVPLQTWVDVKGSRLTLWSPFQALWDLAYLFIIARIKHVEK